MKKLILLIMLATTATCWSQPWVVAHRGYWKADGSAQNSRRSLVKADSIHCWGSEFDVWMSRDGVLFVNHDETINGIEIQKAKAREVRDQKLSNGETIPTLEQLLQVAQGTTLQLVCELKPHDDKYQEAQAIKKILKLFKKYGMENRVTYITFSYPGMRLLIQQAPKGTEVYYLNGELSPITLKTLGSAGPDYEYCIFKSHPEWIQECEQLGMKTNVWTVNKREDLQWCIDNGIDYITTNEPELLQQMLK
ncbi:MAG: glycerophosphodiester phosphodiesterase [Muribaculaceae bacterium]|nr:glycerophosphodiester phosphodiesterase [Muribaculaceae bacterium]